MKLFAEKNLTKWIVIIPILSVLFTVFVFVSTGVKRRTDEFSKIAEFERVNLLKQYKKEALQKVELISFFLKNTKQLQEEQSRQDIKHIVELAFTMISNIYENNKNLTEDEILEKIKIALRDIRFWNKTGYFFIYKLDGLCVLLPPKPSFENKNLIELKDAKGNFTIKNAISMLKEKDEGFLEWYWNKPGKKLLKKKIGFLKVFKPLDIYIGTARYEEDILNSIKSKTIHLLKNSEDRLSIYDKFGKSVLDNKQNIDRDKLTVIKKGTKIIPEGFFINHTTSVYHNIFKESKSGTYFVKYIPFFDWIVTFDTYNKELIENFKKQEEKIAKENKKLIKNRIYFASLVLFFVLLITTFFANKLKKVLKQYQKNLLKEHQATLEQKEKLTYNLKHDNLTSLPNRVLLNDRLKQAIKHAQREEKQIAVIFVDVDKFKSVNDDLGHNTGDMLLIEIAKRLKNSIRQTDTVARFGGDEFIVLIEDIKNIHDIIKVISKIQAALEKKIMLGQTEHYITLSMGVSIFPNDGKTTQTILKNADMAMYRAKQDGGNSYRFFKKSMNEKIQNQIKLEKELRNAIKNNELILHYQPIVETKSKKIIGVEALVRWNHPTKGLLFPDKFISIAEQSSIIIEIGEWIIFESMRQMSEWKNRGYDLQKISINIAVKQLEDKAFIKSIKNSLEKTSCKANCVELEIIERFAMKDIKKSIEVLNEIRKMGINIAIDDFGTGHSSMAYLKQLPVTKLKIDRTFVKDILDNPKDKAIAEAILALGFGLNLEVLAEGIETNEQREFFEYYNCHQMQGYFFSKPLASKEIEKLLSRGFA